MNKRAMFFLKRRVNLIMVIKIFLKIFLFLLTHKLLFSEINRSNSIKDLVLINNLIKFLEINNQEFINQIDNEIVMRFGQNSIKNDGIKNFLRFSRIRDEFLINYFQNKLVLSELSNLFKNLENLNLPISTDNCLIIKEVIDLRDNKEFVESFYKNLKNNTRDIQVTINEIKYKVCINELAFKNIENLITQYIQTQTAVEFEKFVYEKSKN